MKMALDVDRLRPDQVVPPPLPPQKPQPKPVDAGDEGKVSFAEHLQRECKDIGCRMNFSLHAQTRVDSRDIDLQPDQLVRIDKAVDSAAEKGADKALVMLDDLALIVGVRKRTVITVVDGQALRNNVFTSIDSAVIA